MTDVKRRCRGLSRQTDERCRNKAVPGSNYCKFHGAQALGNKGGGGRPKGTRMPLGTGAPKGNTNAMKHGAYSARILPEEEPYFEIIKAEFEEELGGEKKLSASDRLLIFRLAANGAKLTVATGKEAGPEATVPLQRLELELLRELKTTRASKDGGSAMGNTPAEVIGVLLAKVRERQALASPPQPVDDEVIDDEAFGVREDDDGDE